LDSAQLFSFVATANCGVLCGLKIDFLDIDPDTWNISIEKLEKKLKIAKKKEQIKIINYIKLFFNKYA